MQWAEGKQHSRWRHNRPAPRRVSEVTPLPHAELLKGWNNRRDHTGRVLGSVLPPDRYTVPKAGSSSRSEPIRGLENVYLAVHARASPPRDPTRLNPTTTNGRWPATWLRLSLLHILDYGTSNPGANSPLESVSVRMPVLCTTRCSALHDCCSSVNPRMPCRV